MLLKYHNLTITEISSIIGYKEQSYCYKVFTKKYNIMPIKCKKD